MKKLITLVGVFALVVTFTSCGTLGSLATHGKRPVFLVQAPADLQASLNGKTINITKDEFASSEHSTGYSNTTISYFARSLRLPYKKSIDVELYSPSTGQRAKVHLKSKASGKIILGDILLGAGWLLLDIPTKNHKILKPHYIDVPRALEGKPMKEWRKQGKLKRMAKGGK